MSGFLNKNFSIAATKTISLLWAGSLGAAAIAFITQIILARSLGASGYGDYSSSFTLVSIFSPLAGFGIGSLWLRIFGQHGFAGNKLIPASFSFIRMSTLIAIISYIAASLVTSKGDADSNLVALALIGVIFGQLSLELMSGQLRVEGSYLSLALWQLLPHLFRLLGILIAIFLFGKLNTLTAAFSSGIALLLIFFLSLPRLISISRLGIRPQGQTAIPTITSELALKKHNAFTIFSEAWPFGIAGIFYLLFYQGSIVIVERLSGADEAGNLGAALSIMAAIYLLPSAIYQKYLLPKIHRWATHDRKKLISVYKSGLLLMSALGILTMVSMLIACEFIIQVLFGKQFEKSILIFQILALGIPFRFASTSIGAFLVTDVHMKRKVKYMAIVSVASITLNFLLVPYYTAYGAALVATASEIILFIFYVRGARKYVFAKEKATYD